MVFVEVNSVHSNTYQAAPAHTSPTHALVITSADKSPKPHSWMLLTEHTTASRGGLRAPWESLKLIPYVVD